MTSSSPKTPALVLYEDPSEKQQTIKNVDCLSDFSRITLTYSADQGLENEMVSLTTIDNPG